MDPSVEIPIEMDDEISPDRREAYREFVMSTQRIVSPTMFGMFSMDEDLMDSTNSNCESQRDSSKCKSNGSLASNTNSETNFSWSISHISSIYGQTFENTHEIDTFHNIEGPEVTDYLHSQSRNYFLQDAIIASPEPREPELTFNRVSQARNTKDFMDYLQSIKSGSFVRDKAVSHRNDDYEDDDDDDDSEDDALERTQMSVDESIYITPKKSAEDIVGDSDYVTGNTMELGSTTPTNLFSSRKTPHKWPRALFDFSPLSPIGRRIPLSNITGLQNINVKRCSNIEMDMDHSFPNISPICDTVLRPKRSATTPRGFEDMEECSPIAKPTNISDNSVFKTPVSSSKRPGTGLNRTKLFSQEITSTPK